VGPYEILDILNENNVKIKINNNRIKIVHTDKLKLAESRRPTTPINPHHAAEPCAEPSNEAAVSEKSSPDQLSLNTQKS